MAVRRRGWGAGGDRRAQRGRTAVLRAIARRHATRPEPWREGALSEAEPVVAATFDIPFMTRLSVGPSWYRLTPDQKQRAATAYGRYVTAVYATRFDDYAGQKFEVLGEQRIKHGTLVRTQIIKANGEPVSINYVVHNNDTAWQIRDVYVGDAISELATRRSEFASILRSSGIDGLIASLNKKADDLNI